MSAILDTTEQQTLTSPEQSQNLDALENTPSLTFFDLVAAVAEVAEDDAETIAIVKDMIHTGQVRVADLPFLVLPDPSQLD